MTQQVHTLNYGQAPRRNSMLRRITWITLLSKAAITLGLTCLLCGTVLCMILVVRPGVVQSLHGFWLRFLLVFGGGFFIGIAESVCSFMIRRRSSAATIVAMVLVLPQLAWLAFLEYRWMQVSEVDVAWVGHCILGSIIAFEVVMGILLWCCLRERASEKVAFTGRL